MFIWCGVAVNKRLTLLFTCNKFVLWEPESHKNKTENNYHPNSTPKLQQEKKIMLHTLHTPFTFATKTHQHTMGCSYYHHCDQQHHTEPHHHHQFNQQCHVESTPTPPRRSRSTSKNIRAPLLTIGRIKLLNFYIKFQQ